MNFLCPACKTPLPVSAPAVVACTQCGVEVDLTRVDTAPGQARLWPEVDLTGEKLGDFKLLSRAGSGGMGTVYVAEGLAGRAAVKVLSAQLAADPSLRERFRREAGALRAVQHPNIVRILGEGQQDGFCWYAMEHVDGKDLRARLAEGPLPPPQVEALARQLLEALAAVHEAQLVHRDIKPGNILLSSTGPRLCDFGIARFDGATTLTESAALLGSLRYMSPEQRAGVTTAKSDLYSLGLVLHEAVTGGLPGERDLPGGRLGKLIETLLQASPAKRPADARAAAKLIAPRKLRRPGTAVIVASALLGVAGFSSWAVLATRQLKPVPPLPQPAPKVVVARAEVVDAGPETAPPPGPPIPRVVADPARVEGELPAALVEKLVGLNQRGISACYETALKTNPRLEGKLAARITLRNLAAEGRFFQLLRPTVLGAGKMKASKAPSTLAEPELDTTPPPAKSSPKKPVRAPQQLDVELAESTVDDPAFEACVLQAIRGWKMPFLPKGKALVTVGWSFSPSGGVEPVEPNAAIGTKDLGTKGVRGKPLPVKN